jgi:hypothetical protein
LVWLFRPQPGLLLPRDSRTGLVDPLFGQEVEKELRKKSDQAKWLPVLAASLPSLIIWKTNCAVHDGRWSSDVRFAATTPLIS